MKSTHFFLLFAIAAALVLPACGDDANAATVNGGAIANGEFQRETKALAGNSAYVEFVTQNGLTAVKKGKLNADLTAGWLTQLINYKLSEQEFAKRKLTVSDADRAEATTGAPGLFGTQAAWDAFPDWFKKLMIERQAKLIALTWSFVGGRKADDAAKRAYFDSTLKRELATYCVEHILLDPKSKSEAEQISKQLQADPSKFADIAKEKSKDPGSGAKGGDLGCGPSSQYVAPFAKAVQTQPVGQIGNPVESQFGWHVIRVRSIEKEPTFEEVLPTFDDEVKKNANRAFSEWFNTAIGKADVSVDSSYGKVVKKTEQGQTQLYVAPKVEKTTTTVPANDLGGGGQLPPGADLGGGGQLPPGADLGGGGELPTGTDGAGIPTDSAPAPVPAPSTPGG